MALTKVTSGGLDGTFPDDSIVNADVNSSAAIALSKLATDPSNATNLASGTVPTARLGSGTASSSTVLYGDQTYKAEPGGGITEVDMWVLDTSFTGDAQPITSNIVRADLTGFEETKMGTGMTFSSGVFTFPSTGYWLVQSIMNFNLNGDSAYVNNNIDVTINNSTYYEVVRGNDGIAQSQSSTTYTSNSQSLIVDVTNTTNVKVRFGTQASSTSTTTMGANGTGAALNGTRFIFIRLGDT